MSILYFLGVSALCHPQPGAQRKRLSLSTSTIAAQEKRYRVTCMLSLKTFAQTWHNNPLIFHWPKQVI